MIHLVTKLEATRAKLDYVNTLLQEYADIAEELYSFGSPTTDLCSLHWKEATDRLLKARKALAEMQGLKGWK